MTGKRGWLLLGIAGGLVAAPSAARANPPGESLNFDNYCVMGAMRVCASVRLQSVGNHLSMQVWNLEGAMGNVNTISAIGLYHTSNFSSFGVSSYDVHYVQNGHQTDIRSFWSAGNSSGIQGASELYLGAQGNNGITGCVNPGGKNATHWSTCNSFPGVPYVQFDFTLANQAHFGLTDVGLLWNSKQVPGAGSLICDTGKASCVDPVPLTTSVTPEPMTMVLLGTGLAGMGGGGFFRRRKKKDPQTA